MVDLSGNYSHQLIACIAHQNMKQMTDVMVGYFISYSLSRVYCWNLNL